MTAQLLGGTLGMAGASTVFVSTGSYSAVLVANAVLPFGLFVLGVTLIRRREPAPQ